MGREYKAFISYRHLPLEMAVAKKLHRRIERYVIPKALRKGGAKKLGLVFRDQDELPIASDLGSNIQKALDASEYLIVICTPETEKSRWVMGEINYFLEKHDRDHVLAVLADGTPDTSFPAPLTELRPGETGITERIEPLAANIVADSAAKRSALFKTESLRILAALIGCPFDALYQRERRYRRRRTASAALVAAALTGAFIGMLLNRNAEISQQLQMTLENESRVLAELSASELEKGNYHAAVEYALKALPSEKGERPYVAQAEWQLGKALLPYQQGSKAYDQSFEQATSISALALSEDGALAFTADEFGCVRGFDTYSGAMLWEKRSGSGSGLKTFHLEAVSPLDALFYWNISEDIIGLYDARTGEPLWQEDDLYLIAAEQEQGLFLSLSWDKYRHEYKLLLRRLDDGEILNSCIVADYISSYVLSGCISPDGRYAAVLLSGASLRSNEGDDNPLMVWDLENGTLTKADEAPQNYSASYRLAFAAENRLLMAYDIWDAGGETRCYQPARGWEMLWRTETRSADNYPGGTIDGGITTEGEISVLGSLKDGSIVVGGLYALARLDPDSGKVLWRKSMKDRLVSVIFIKPNSMCVMMEDGTFSIMTAGGILGTQAVIGFFSADFPVKVSALTGGSYYETIVAMVPARYPNRVAIVRQREATEKVLEGGELLQDYLVWATSPSGELLAAAEYDYGSKCVIGEIWNLAEGTMVKRFSVPSDSERFNGVFALTEDGVLIANGCVLDSAAETLVSLNGEEELPKYSSSCKTLSTKANGKIITAVLSSDVEGHGFPLFIWEDGRTLLAKTRAFPAERYKYGSSNRLLAVGGNGCALVSYAGSEAAKPDYALFSAEKGTWLALPDLDASVFALSADGRYLAAQTEEGPIVLYDTATGEALREMASPLPAVSVTKLLFADGDRLLLLFTRAGALAVFDTENGRCLHRSSFSESNLKFYEAARYDVFAIGAQNRLLIVYDYSGFRESGIFMIDMDTWACCGDFEGVACYVPSTGELILSPYNAGVYRTPLLDTDGLRQLALEFLDRKPAE